MSERGLATREAECKWLNTHGMLSRAVKAIVCLYYGDEEGFSEAEGMWLHLEPVSLGKVLTEGRRAGEAIPEEELRRRRILAYLGELSDWVFAEIVKEVASLEYAYKKDTDYPIRVPGTKELFELLSPLVKAEKVIRWGRG